MFSAFLFCVLAHPSKDSKPGVLLYHERKSPFEKDGWKAVDQPDETEEERITNFSRNGAVTKLSDKARIRYSWVVIKEVKSKKKGLEIDVRLFLRFPDQEELEFVSVQG